MRVMVQRASGVGLAFAVAAVAAAAFLPPTASATYPGANGRIAFTSLGMPGCAPASDSWGAICTVKPDGSGLKRISASGRAPSWSANGRRIVFATDKAIYTIKADGTDKTRVASTGGYDWSSPAFAPSGGRIVYTRKRPNEPAGQRGAIYTIRTDGTHERLLVAAGGAWHVPETPTYSPDGSRIVFAGQPVHRSWGIWTIHPDGSHLRSVTINPHLLPRDHFPDWSPDGSHIEFLRSDSCDPLGCGDRVKFIRPDGSGMHGIGVASHTRSRYRYAPSGDRLVSWTADPDDNPVHPICTDLFTVAVVGGDRQTVTDNCPAIRRYALMPSWQPLPGG